MRSEWNTDHHIARNILAIDGVAIAKRYYAPVPDLRHAWLSFLLTIDLGR